MNTEITDSASGIDRASGVADALDPVAVYFTPGPSYALSSRLWQGIPGIERAENGRLWACWYSGGRTEEARNHALLITSGDDGATWSEPVLVIDPPGQVRAADPVLWHAPNGYLWLFWMQTSVVGRQLFDGRGGVWAIHTKNSGAANPRWSSPRRIANGVMMNKPTGRLVNGLRIADCQPISRSSRNERVTWSGGDDLSHFDDCLIRIRFDIHRAKLRGFRFQPD